MKLPMWKGEPDTKPCGCKRCRGGHLGIRKQKASRLITERRAEARVWINKTIRRF